MKELEASLEKAEQLKRHLVLAIEKERAKLREAKKETEKIKKNNVQLGKQKDELEVCACVYMFTIYSTSVVRMYTCAHTNTHTHTHTHTVRIVEYLT